MKRFTNRLSPATVIACIALFVSLGGVSYGVATGSIDSREIKNNTIRSKDIRNSQVYSKDVRNSQILTQDIRNSTVRGSDVRNDSLTGADILESSLGKVPSASSADNAVNAVNANTVGGQPASAFASKGAGVTTAFMVDASALENQFGPQPTFDANVAGADVFTFPYSINDGSHNAVVAGGGAGDTGGTVPCIHAADPVDADTLRIESLTDAGAACSEEYTVVVY